MAASFLTSAEVQYLQKKVSISYASEEDSIKVDIVPGDQEQQENQGLLSSSSNTVATRTGSPMSGSLGTEVQTVSEVTIWRI